MDAPILWRFRFNRRSEEKPRIYLECICVYIQWRSSLPCNSARSVRTCLRFSWDACGVGGWKSSPHSYYLTEWPSCCCCCYLKEKVMFSFTKTQQHKGTNCPNQEWILPRRWTQGSQNYSCWRLNATFERNRSQSLLGSNKNPTQFHPIFLFAYLDCTKS